MMMMMVVAVVDDAIGEVGEDDVVAVDSLDMMMMMI